MARLRGSTNYRICRNFADTLERVGVWESNGFKQVNNGFSMQFTIRNDIFLAPSVAELGDLMFNMNKNSKIKPN